MVRFIRDEIVCRRGVGLSQGYSIPQLGIIVLSNTSYHSLPSPDMFPSFHSSPNHSSHGLIRPAVSRVTRGEDAELVICSSVHVGESRSALQSCSLGEDYPASSACQEVFWPISSTSFSLLILPPAAKNLCSIPSTIPFPCLCLEPQLDYLFFELGLGFTSSGFTGCNMTLLTICCVFL